MSYTLGIHASLYALPNTLTPTQLGTDTHALITFLYSGIEPPEISSSVIASSRLVAASAVRAAGTPEEPPAYNSSDLV